MGDTGTVFRGVSLTPRAGVGVVTDGKLIDFNSPFPSGATRLVGGELSIDFGRLRDNAPKRVGELALMYYWGHAEDKFDQSDLPLGNSPVANLIQFSSQRESNSHFILAEWRWPSFAPVYSNERWSLIHPQFGVGAGGIIVNTRITQEGSEPKNEGTVALVVTGSTQVRLVQLSIGHFEMSLEGAVRVFAGQAFGMAGEGGLRFAYRRF